MKYIQKLDHQRERVQKTPMTGASYKSHHVDVVVVVGWWGRGGKKRRGHTYLKVPEWV